MTSLWSDCTHNIHNTIFHLDLCTKKGTDMRITYVDKHTHTCTHVHTHTQILSVEDVFCSLYKIIILRWLSFGNLGKKGVEQWNLKSLGFDSGTTTLTTQVHRHLDEVVHFYMFLPQFYPRLVQVQIKKRHTSQRLDLVQFRSSLIMLQYLRWLSYNCIVPWTFDKNSWDYAAIA